MFIPLVSFFYFFVSGFKVSSDKRQMSSDPDLKGYFVDAKNGDDENNANNSTRGQQQHQPSVCPDFGFKQDHKVNVVAATFTRNDVNSNNNNNV